jgi:hypothetical protein
MSKNTNLFEIEDFNLFDEEIEVIAIKGEQEKTISVPRGRFEKWLQNDDRLEYCIDSVDHTGEHVQNLGTISVEDYWSDINISKTRDLYEFIVLKMMDSRKIFDIQTPLKSILNAYTLLTATNS